MPESGLGFPIADLLALSGWRRRDMRVFHPETELEYDISFDVWHWRGRSLSPMTSVADVLQTVQRIRVILATYSARNHPASG